MSAKKTRYFAVARGHQPGIFTNYDDALKSHSNFPNSSHKRFSTREEAVEFIRKHFDLGGPSPIFKDGLREVPIFSRQKPTPTPTIEIREPDEEPSTSQSSTRESSPIPPGALEPPPSSYFASSQNFEPDENATFKDEFRRYMSSQGVKPGSQEYRREEVVALDREFVYFYTDQEAARSRLIPLTEEEQHLEIYRNMCLELGLPAYEEKEDCILALQKPLVNIIDYIDAKRTGQPIKVWQGFGKFKAYTLREGKTIPRNEAKDNKFLCVLLRRLVKGTESQFAKNNRKVDSLLSSKRKRESTPPEDAKRVRI